jgi:hypothetical protein
MFEVVKNYSLNELKLLPKKLEKQNKETENEIIDETFKNYKILLQKNKSSEELTKDCKNKS